MNGAWRLVDEDNAGERRREETEDVANLPTHRPRRRVLSAMLPQELSWHRGPDLLALDPMVVRLASLKRAANTVNTVPNDATGSI